MSELLPKERIRILSALLSKIDDDQLAELVELLLGDDTDGDFRLVLDGEFLRGEKAGEYSSFDDYLQLLNSRIALILDHDDNCEDDDYDYDGD